MQNGNFGPKWTKAAFRYLKQEVDEVGDVKVCKDCYIPKVNVKYYFGYTSNVVKHDVTRKRKEGKVVDLTSGKKIQSVIYLMTGELVLVNTSIATIADRMMNCNDGSTRREDAE